LLYSASSPVRIDLAGGTLDLFPLYLFEGGAMTVNMAIDPLTECTIELSADDKIVITSPGTDKEVSFTVDTITHEHGLGLISRAVSFFRPVTGMRISACSNVPRGSGLGASSSLLVSVIKCMNDLPESAKMFPCIKNWQQLLAIAQGLETWHLQVPTGQQDYLAAIHGGLRSYSFGIEGLSIIDPCSQGFSQFIAEHLVLYYTGQSHLSALPNWEVFQSRVNKQAVTVESLKIIKKITMRIHEALQQEDFEKFARLLGKEWSVRKKLSPAVTTPAIDRIMKKALAAGALSGKVAGAGGGGCVFFLTGDTLKLSEVLAKEEGRVLEFNFSPGKASCHDIMTE